MENKLLAIIVLVVIASLSVAGCTVGIPSTSSPTPTPTPIPTATTPTPSADYSSYFNKAFEAGNSIMERPFTKSTNARGNDVYKGIGRNSSLPESAKMTDVLELTKSKAEAKQLYDQTVAQKVSEGFVIIPAFVAADKAATPYPTEVWYGVNYSNGQAFVAEYYYESYTSSWLFVTEAQG